MARTSKHSRFVAHTIQPQWLMSPDVPAGYQTVAGWWVTRELSAFELLYNPFDTLREEEEALRQRCQRTGVVPLCVSPSPLYQALGRDAEMAFTLEMLETHYPENP